MKDNYILTAESVTEGHPDKLCDTIADAVVDACLKHDPSARVACEVMATAGKITAAGEITAVKLPDIPSIICKTVQRAGYGGSEYEVEVITHEQSPDIAGAVKGTQDTGAGDQGIVYGYACDETPEFLPLPVVFAHRLTRMLSHVRVLGIVPELRPDGKSQVSVEYEHGRPRRIAAVVLSCQHEEDADLDALRRDLTQYVILPSLRELPPDERTEILINPSGRFVEGGFEADTGLTGVAVNDAVERALGEGDLPGQTAGLELLGYQMLAGNVVFLHPGITGQLNDIHAVTQRAGNGAQIICRGDKKHMAQIKRHIDKVIIKGGVLLGIKSFQQVLPRMCR